ncbi:MAG TPA: hypothetical protein DDZ78_16465, partial [Porphyromonadaceae bacterium]|nr:hypothetical protein [Porphyromonadaceae bacterium]
MNIKKLLVAAIMPVFCITVFAQSSVAPSKGNVTLAATVSYNSYASIEAPEGTLDSYQLAALSTNWSDKKLQVGFEAGWFVSNAWKLNLGGGLHFAYTPGYTGVPGTGDVENGGIPDYRAVAKSQTFVYTVSAGADRYFSTRIDNLYWYSGVRVGLAYGLNEKKYDEAESMGKSIGEAWNLRAAFTSGIDYFVLPALYVGAQIDPLSYTYGVAGIQPQSGLKLLQADSHS